MYVVSADCKVTGTERGAWTEQQNQVWGLDGDHLALQTVRRGQVWHPPPPAGRGVPLPSEHNRRQAQEIVAACSRPSREVREEPDCHKRLLETSAALIEQQHERNALRERQVAEAAATQAAAAAQPQPCFDAGSSASGLQEPTVSSLLDQLEQVQQQDSDRLQKLLLQQEEWLRQERLQQDAARRAAEEHQQRKQELNQRLLRHQEEVAEQLVKRQQKERVQKMQEAEDKRQEAAAREEAQREQQRRRAEEEMVVDYGAGTGTDASSSGSDGESEASVQAAGGSAEPAAGAGEPNFRRNGLPARVLVMRSGDVFMSSVHQYGGQLELIDKVARILDVRQEFIRSQSRASTPVVASKGALTVLVRASQLTVWNNLLAEWCEGEGEKYDRGVGSGTEAQRTRVLAGYYKTHCFQTFGGVHWLKFLIAVGDVGTGAVEATNELVLARMKEKRGQSGSLYTRPPDDDVRWQRRDRRPTPCFDAGTKPKELRNEVKRLQKKVDERRHEMRHRQMSPDEEASFAEQEARLDEASRLASAASLASSHEPGRPAQTPTAPPPSYSPLPACGLARAKQQHGKCMVNDW